MAKLEESGVGKMSGLSLPLDWPLRGGFQSDDEMCQK